jgi:chromatin remodeling complex protein RSC6
MNKRGFVLLGVIAAAGIGGLVWKGVIPPKSGVQGSIGAATRYQSEQIANSDVVVDPTALNDLLQSDVIHRLAKDPEFRKMVTSESFKSLAASGEFQRLAKSEDFLSLIRKPEFNKFATSGALAEFGKGALVAHDEQQMNKGALVARDEQQANKIATIDWNKVNLPKEYEKIAKSAEFQKLATTSPDFAKLITTESFAKALTASPDLAKVVGSGDFQKLISTDVGAKALASPELERTVNRSAGE